MQILFSLFLIEIHLFLIVVSKKLNVFDNRTSYINAHRSDFSKLTSRHNIQYPRKFDLTPNDLTERCQAAEPIEGNKFLKNQGHFYIKKQSGGNVNEGQEDLDFVVVLEATQQVTRFRAIAYLHLLKSGHSYVEVQEKYRGCGLAKYLMHKIYEISFLGR